MESSTPTVNETIDTSIPVVSFTDISTNRYFSVEISQLMPLITDDLSNNENLIYLNAAVQLAKEAKDHLKSGEFALAVNIAAKASARIEKLCSIRQETQPDFMILKAPFYYLVGHCIISYVENSSDVFGNVPQLPEPEDSELESEIEDDDENESSQDEVKKSNKDADVQENG